MDPNLDYEWELFCNGTWACYDFMAAAICRVHPGTRRNASLRPGGEPT